MGDMTQADFAMKHGQNTTDRIAPDLLEKIAELLNGKTIEYNGRTCLIKKVGGLYERDGEWRFMFDVKYPCDQYDHVEFTVTKTGFGGSL